MRKHELVIIWETGEKEVHEYESQELAEQAERGYKAAFGNQIQWSGTRPQTQMEHLNEWRMERTRHEKEDFQGNNDCSHRGGGVQHYGNRRG